MDRGYHDFSRLYALHQAKANFIIRDKTNTLHRRIYSRPVNKNTELRCDQTVALSPYGSERCPELLRLVRFFSSKSDRYLTFLTNNFIINAVTIADLYKSRWKIELFFKWAKTAPTDQGVLRDIRERSQDANLNRHIRLRAHSNYQKAVGLEAGSLHYFTDSEYQHIRESADSTNQLMLSTKALKMITNYYYSTYDGTLLDRALFLNDSGSGRSPNKNFDRNFREWFMAAPCTRAMQSLSFCEWFMAAPCTRAMQSLFSRVIHGCPKEI
jgi:hypothetical protein